MTDAIFPGPGFARKRSSSNIDDFDSGAVCLHREVSGQCVFDFCLLPQVDVCFVLPLRGEGDGVKLGRNRKSMASKMVARCEI